MEVLAEEAGDGEPMNPVSKSKKRGIIVHYVPVNGTVLPTGTRLRSSLTGRLVIGTTRYRDNFFVPLTGILSTIDVYVYTYIDIYGTKGQKVPFVLLTNVPLTGTDFCLVNERPVDECPVNGDIVYCGKIFKLSSYTNAI
jgi:hypothetical protein